MNDTSPDQTPAPTIKPDLKFSLSWRAVALILLAVIAVMTYVWKPWEKTSAVRTITIQGEATVSAVPDTYSFQPIFEAADVKSVTATGNDAVVQLKKLGLKDADIKTTISAPSELKPMPLGASAPDIATSEPNGMPYRYSNSATYSITVTATSKTLAQKVSDYLATTAAVGQVTPTATFSKTAQTKLDLTARSQASDNAKAKANVTAKQLGAHLGKVVKISDSDQGGIYPMSSTDGASSSQPAKAAGGPTIQPGTNDVNYSLTVEFELK